MIKTYAITDKVMINSTPLAIFTILPSLFINYLNLGRIIIL